MRSKFKKNLNNIIFIFLLLATAYLAIDFEETPLYGSIMCGEGTCICMCLGSNCGCDYSANGCYCWCNPGEVMICTVSHKDPQLPPT
ncbi:MAG TPA: hypothetical protein VK469_12370 [Candidatus Kapabacteria bacterium]|nr:hypothetical protein [Candidatus Kapabacteria bacterium]